MELFGIIFSIPVAFVINMVYCAFLAKSLRRIGRVRRVIHHGRRKPYDMQAVVRGMDLVLRLVYVASLVLLGSFLIELARLVTLGAVRSRAVVGTGFYLAHVVFFFLGTPALANVLILRERGPFAARWYFAAVICTLLSFFLVILQYGVSEALYGFEGHSGPYS